MSGIDEEVHVPLGAAPAFLARIEAVNRRARRLRLGIAVSVEALGEGPRTVTVTREVFRDGSLRRETGPETRPCALFRLSCPEPVVALPGWAYAGYVAAKGAERDVATGAVRAMSFSPFHEGGRLPGDFLAAAFSPSGMMRCDHCGTFRNRRLGIVVRGPSGEHRIVGSACARDYLGHDPKAVLAHFQHVPALRREVDAERRGGWYRIDEVDMEARRLAAEAARAARESLTYPVADIVAATLVAMAEQGFYARTDWDGKRATADRAGEILADGSGYLPHEVERAAEILAWGRSGAFAGLPAEGDLSLGDYRTADPGHRIVEAYRLAGFPPVGTFHAGEGPVEIALVSSREVEDFGRDARGWGSRPSFGSGRFVHEFADRAGTRLVWETSSPRPAGFARAEWVEASFEVRRRWTERCVACLAVRRVRSARPVRGRKPAGNNS